MDLTVTPPPCDTTGDKLSISHFRTNGEILEDDEHGNGDYITTVKYSHNGELVAFGDKTGRIAVFRHSEKTGEYEDYVSFTSHEREFDCLKSTSIEEAINSIEWLKRTGPNYNLLTANEKTVKLWRLTERTRAIAETDVEMRDPDEPITSADLLSVPKIVDVSMQVEATPRRVYANAHGYHIQSVSVCADQDMFLSADDLRINVWHHEITKECFNVVDLKPPSLSQLREVITSAEFSPTHGSLFAYATTSGNITLCDMREKAIKPNSKFYFAEPNFQIKDGFGDIVSCVGHIRFSHSGNYIAARDVFTVKLWDIRMTEQPSVVIPVHDALLDHIDEFYESEGMFDRFTTAWSPEDKSIATGTYSSLFKTFNAVDGSLTGTYEASVSQYLAKCRSSITRRKRRRSGQSKGPSVLAPGVPLDFDSKTLFMDWHPRSKFVAVACTEKLFFFNEVL
ncbi:hypothetical protein L596_010005 [Steinernema carpocapsae]|uniref:Serine/threonine-protein phosphatase 2A 55 kDa regulatory subunit B n=1 Tax=Steinernema carpocapsae TaxID=34508 RepID=A0A4U5PH02_STECR|nr:hypothetical protein L596_010005 [Steinernema carpocapsae]